MKKEKNKNSKTIFKEFKKLHITDETKTCGENQPKSGIFFPFKVTILEPILFKYLLLKLRNNPYNFNYY